MLFDARLDRKHAVDHDTAIGAAAKGLSGRLVYAAEPADVVHVVAHCDGHTIGLPNGPVPIDEAVRRIVEPLPPKLVTLMMCNGANADAGFGHVASRLLGAGVRCVVASRVALSLHDATQFSVAFYEAFMQGCDPVAAMRRGRTRMRAESLVPLHHAALSIYTSTAVLDNPFRSTSHDTSTVTAGAAGPPAELWLRPREDDETVEQRSMRLTGSPLELLEAHHRITPLVGATRELAELEAWLDTPLPIAAAVIHGDRGCGKSRLAAELVSVAKAWGGGFARVGTGAEAGAHRLLDSTDHDLLIVIDDAEASSTSVAGLVNAAADTVTGQSKPARRVRLVLVTQSIPHDGDPFDWFPQIRTRRIPHTQITLGDLGSSERQRLYISTFNAVIDRTASNEESSFDPTTTVWVAGTPSEIVLAASAAALGHDPADAIESLTERTIEWWCRYLGVASIADRRTLAGALAYATLGTNPTDKLGLPDWVTTVWQRYPTLAAAATHPYRYIGPPAVTAHLLEQLLVGRTGTGDSHDANSSGVVNLFAKRHSELATACNRLAQHIRTSAPIAQWAHTTISELLPELASVAVTVASGDGPNTSRVKAVNNAEASSLVDAVAHLITSHHWPDLTIIELADQIPVGLHGGFDLNSHPLVLAGLTALATTSQRLVTSHRNTELIDIIETLVAYAEYSAQLERPHLANDAVANACGLWPTNTNTIPTVHWANVGDKLVRTSVARGFSVRALPIAAHIYQIRQHLQGERHPDTLTSLSNLAFCLCGMGDGSQALPLFRICLKFRREGLGERHPDTIGSLNDLGFCHLVLKDPERARPLLEACCALSRLVLGERHPETLTSMNNLAQSYEGLGRAPEAMHLHQHCYLSRRELLGDRHPHTLTSLNNLANTLETLGDAKGALPLYQRNYRLMTEVRGERHPETLSSLNNLAYCYAALDDLDRALSAYQVCYESSRQVLGDDHPNTVITHTGLMSTRRRLAQVQADAEATTRRSP